MERDARRRCGVQTATTGPIDRSAGLRGTPARCGEELQCRGSRPTKRLVGDAAVMSWHGQWSDRGRMFDDGELS